MDNFANTNATKFISLLLGNQVQQLNDNGRTKWKQEHNFANNLRSGALHVASRKKRFRNTYFVITDIYLSIIFISHFLVLSVYINGILGHQYSQTTRQFKRATNTGIQLY